MSAALLLELAFGFGLPRDRLAVRDLHVFGLDLDAELARELLERDRQVRLTHAAQQGLVRLRVALDAHHRIFVLQPVQRVRELVLVGLGLGVDRDREHGVGRARTRLASTSTPLAASTSPVARSFELGDGRDVAGRDLAHGVLFLAAHREELVDPFVGCACGR